MEPDIKQDLRQSAQEDSNMQDENSPKQTMVAQQQNQCAQQANPAECQPCPAARQPGSGMRQSGSNTRHLNAFLTVVIAVCFFIHLGLGLASLYVLEPSAMSFVVWAGMAIILVHVILSIRTTRDMWTDTERQPSPKKKQHQILKWITGALVAAAVVLHIVVGTTNKLVPVIMVVAVIVTVTIHLNTGRKSLLKDMGFSKKYRPALQVIFIVLGVAFTAVALCSLL